MTAHLLLALLLQALSSTAFYLPGVAPQSWNEGDPVVVEVDSLTSPKTRLPYDYYDFPFCRPEKGVVAAGETLGEIFAGMRTESTGYEVTMNENFNCKVLCKVDMDTKQIKQMKQLIDDQYVINLMVDNLPGAMEMQNNEGGDDNVQFGLGYWVGGIILDLPAEVVNDMDDQSDDQSSNPLASLVKRAKESETAPRYINNHVVFKLFYHVPTTLSNTIYQTDDPVSLANVDAETNEGGGALKKNQDGTNAKRIVRFEVHPYSIKHVYDKQADKFDPATVQTCKPDSKVFGEVGNGQNMLLDTKSTSTQVVYSYGIEWINSPTSWVSGGWWVVIVVVRWLTCFLIAVVVCFLVPCCCAGDAVGHLFVDGRSNARRHSLVVHYQFHFGRGLSDRPGGLDLGPHPAQRPHALQPHPHRRRASGGIGGIGVEIGARRCLSTTG